MPFTIDIICINYDIFDDILHNITAIFVYYCIDTELLTNI
jgi:hypothetical protein